jgi:hypothetical protein
MLFSSSPDDVYPVEARTSLGRTSVEVRSDPSADRVIRACSQVGNVTIRTDRDGATR